MKGEIEFWRWLPSFNANWMRFKTNRQPGGDDQPPPVRYSADPANRVTRDRATHQRQCWDGPTHDNMESKSISQSDHGRKTGCPQASRIEGRND
jgi:hypothetical protein